MEKGVSLKLKEAMKKIDKIIKDYDVNACVFLSDGNGCGEYRMHHDTPSWSMLTFSNRGEEKDILARIKAYEKSEPEKTRMTIDSIYNLEGSMKHVWMMTKQLQKVIEDDLDVESETGVIIPEKNE